MKGVVLNFARFLKKGVEEWAALDAVLKILIFCGIAFDVALVMIVSGLFAGPGGMLWLGVILLGISLMVALVAVATEGDLALAIGIAFLIFLLYAVAMPMMLLYGAIACRGGGD